MSRSPLVDALIAFGVSAAVLVGATWVLRTLNDDVTDPVGGVQQVSCDIVVQVTGWHPSFPCWWVFVGAFAVIWGLVFGVTRSR